MQLMSSEDGRVVGARSAIADGITLRAPGAGKARADAIRLPAGVTVQLAPRASRRRGVNSRTPAGRVPRA